MIVSPELEDWMLAQHPGPQPVEKELRERGEAAGFPIIGPLVGQLCRVLALSIGAKRIFEMGSGFGYSTLWFADAVGADGHVTHTDGDPDLSEEAQGWLAKAGLEQRVQFEVGNALASIERTDGLFDIIFIDIDKQDYPAAWEAARQRVRPGGLIITDNTLWSGKVADVRIDDEVTQGVRDYVARAFADPDFDTTIIPLRDGVAVSRRTG